MSAKRSQVLVILAAGMAKRYGGCKPLAPVGLRGEAVIDLTASDAWEAGFTEVVLVLGPATGPAIEYHVRRRWPRALGVHVAYQPVPLGTAHAVLCARQAVGERSFAVVNADDVYGARALGLLAAHFADTTTAWQPVDHALVAFALSDSVVGSGPVTRGTITATEDQFLIGIDERRQIQRQPDGTFSVGDGREPDVLDGTTAVSVNLWGFRPGIWSLLTDAVLASHPELAADLSGATIRPEHDQEVLLPEVLGAAMADPGEALHPGGTDLAGSRSRHRVRVLPGTGRCVGVTHASDLRLVRGVLATMVARGERPAECWSRAA